MACTHDWFLTTCIPLGLPFTEAGVSGWYECLYGWTCLLCGLEGKPQTGVQRLDAQGRGPHGRTLTEAWRQGGSAGT